MLRTARDFSRPDALLIQDQIGVEIGGSRLSSKEFRRSAGVK